MPFLLPQVIHVPFVTYKPVVDSETNSPKCDMDCCYSSTKEDIPLLREEYVIIPQEDDLILLQEEDIFLLQEEYLILLQE